MNIRYFAAARAATECAEEPLIDPEPHASTLSDAIAWILNRHPDASTPSGTPLDQLLAQCSFLLDGHRVAATDTATPLDGVQQLDVLPPFAGG